MSVEYDPDFDKTVKDILRRNPGELAESFWNYNGMEDMILQVDPSFVEGSRCYMELMFQVYQLQDEHTVFYRNSSLVYYIVDNYKTGLSGLTVLKHFKLIRPAPS